MTILIVGLVLFLGAHSISIVASGWRDRTASTTGIGRSPCAESAHYHLTYVNAHATTDSLGLVCSKPAISPGMIGEMVTLAKDLERLRPRP